jgi:hypothetical protein
LKVDTYNILAIAAVVSFFVPLIFVIIKNLWRDSFFLLFAAFWAIGGMVNLPDLFTLLTPAVRAKVGAIYNMIDLPLIITILYLNCTSGSFKRFILGGLILTIAMEITGVALNGIQYDSLKYAMGTGILIIIAIATVEVVRYLQHIEHSNRQTAKIFVYAAVLFEYGTFIVIYIFDYFVETSDRYDTYVVYYISTVIALIIASCGYFLSRGTGQANVTDQ